MYVPSKSETMSRKIKGIFVAYILKSIQTRSVVQFIVSPRILPDAGKQYILEV